MNQKLIDQYRTLRAKEPTMPAKWALSWAKGKLKLDVLRRAYQFPKMLWSDENYEFDLGYGLTAKVELKYDDCCDAPWDMQDLYAKPVDDRHLCFGHQGNPAPGYRVLETHRHTYWVYPFEDAVREAYRQLAHAKYGRAEKWERARYYAQQEYDYLRRYVTDQWCYVGYVVALYRDGKELVSDSLWGIDSQEYATELALECMDHLHEQVRHEDKERERWAERDVLTV